MAALLGVLVLAICLVLGGCGASDSGSSGQNSSASPASETVSETEADAWADAVEDDDEEVTSGAAEGDDEEVTSDAAEDETEVYDETAVIEDAIYYYFRNDRLRSQHYEKHGIEMGFDSAEEYEAAANVVIHDPDALHKTEAEDGDDVYYLEETNEFVIVSTDGYIRTYFLPSGGRSYYDRQ